MSSRSIAAAVSAIRAAQSKMQSFFGDKSGSVATMTALAMPVLIGVAGLGAEVSYWYLTQRSMQNAADSAVIAAATNGGSNYVAEAKAAAARYGFVDGVNGVSIAASNSATCPSGGVDCYIVTVTGYVPLFLSQVVGFRGVEGLGDRPQTKLRAVAVARLDLLPREYCILALGTKGIAFGTNGAPKANLEGCSVMSNADARCNGNNLGADYGDAAGKNDGCGVVQRSNVPRLADPYAGLSSNIPPDTCPSYPQMGQAGSADQVTKWSGPKLLPEVFQICGDLELIGDVTVRAEAGRVVLVIWNGQLYTGRKPNGYTLNTEPGAALTIVFAGDNSPGYTHAPTGDGTLDFAAPTTGPWKGIAIYQAPNLTSGVDIQEAGNSPTWKISGMVYLPHSSVTLSGAIGKSANGAACFGLVVDNILINGTGAIIAHGACDEAGLKLPTGTAPTGRGTLVM